MITSFLSTRYCVLYALSTLLQPLPIVFVGVRTFAFLRYGELILPATYATIRDEVVHNVLAMMMVVDSCAALDRESPARVS